MPGIDQFAELSRFNDVLARVNAVGGVFFSFFMEKPQLDACARASERAGVPFFADGGFQDAERRVACASEDGEQPEFPIVCLSLEWSKDTKAPAHRDILGAILALGIERHCVGDIRVADGGAFVALTDKIAPYVVGTLTQTGGAHVHAVLCAFPSAPKRDGHIMRINCASLRLDAVLQAALRLPRTKAQAVIKEGRVRVDFNDETRPDARIAEGMTVSVRGFGRVRIAEITGESKKGRLFIDVEVFN